MFENVCSFPLSSDLFAQATHPSDNVIAVGLASGHVQALRLPELEEEADDGYDDDEDDAGNANGSERPTNGTGNGGEQRRSSLTPSKGPRTIDGLWRTRRHKGSCRSLTFDGDGKRLLSGGSDGIVKVANSATGQVEQKLAVPGERHSSSGGARYDSPSLVSVLSAETFLVATDGGEVHLYDLRAALGGARPAQTHRPHDDYVSSLTALAPRGQGSVVRQWVTTGATTLAVTDARRGVLARSEPQDEELLSSALMRGLPARGTSVGEKLLVGGSGGAMTLWERGVWDDLDERIVLDGSGAESLEAMAVVPPGVGSGREVLVGMSDGRVKVVHIGQNKVVAEFQHDEVDGVVAISFDHAGRAISGGGQTLKVWQEWEGGAAPDDSSDEDGGHGGGKRNRSDSDDSDDDPRSGRGGKKKKKKRGKARGDSGAPKLGVFDGLD